MENLEVKAKIFYFLRSKLFDSMLAVCKDAVNNLAPDINVHFYHAIALAVNNRYQESIRELNLLKLDSSTRLASIVSLMYIFKFMGTSDKQLFVNLDSDMKDAKKSAICMDFHNTSFALFALGKYEKSLDYIDKAITLDLDNFECWTLKGWIYLYLFQSGAKINVNISDIFRNGLKNPKNLDASIGLSESLNLEGNNEDAIAEINKAIIRFPSSSLPLVCKLKLMFSMQDWEQTIELMNRITNLEVNELEALKTNILILLCRDANYEEAAVCIKRFRQELETKEPKNALPFIENAKLFSRVCGQNLTVLSETYKLVEKGIQIAPNVAEHMTELGYQCVLQGELKEAIRCFKTVTKINDTSVDALMGMTLCELMENGTSANLKQQTDFLFELQENNVSPLLLFMKAKLLDDFSEKFKMLGETYKQHTKLLQGYTYGATYLKLLNPNFVLDIVKEYLRFVPFSTEVLSFRTAKKTSDVVTTTLQILKFLTKACPGLQEALHMLAKILYLKGDNVEAVNTLEHIIKEIDDSSSEAHLLMAQIQVSTGLFDRAAQSLEAGLSHNFKVRENPLYHLISGLIEKNQNNLEGAIKYYTTALSLIELKPKERQLRIDSHLNLTLADKSSIYTELISAHMSLKQIHEATKLLQDATEEFKGTTEEAKITLVSAEHLVKNKDSQTAIDLLSRIEPNDPYYLAAKTKLANIFLKCRKDKRAYLKCYQDMVNSNPGPESFVLLGDAYLYILEHEKALESYEKALKMNPTDPFLMLKMGKALVTTHFYKRAISYYKDAIKLTDNPELKLQLADLYVQLKQTENAENLLKTEIEAEKSRNINDITSLNYRTKLLSLLAQIYERPGDLKPALATYKSAIENQFRIHKLYVVQQTAIPEDVMNTTISINLKLAELASLSRDNQQAVTYYKDALNISPNNCKVLAALAKMYMQMNVMDLCQQTCTTLLSIDPENEDGTVLMADIAFRKVDFDMAIYHFTQLLSKQQTNWRALVRLIEIMRRTGNLQDVFQYIQQAEKLCSIPSKDPGFCYCTALYQWYSGNINCALRNFNIARQHPEWSRQAIYNMIEICLNPEDEILGEQFIDIDDTEYKDSRSMALKTAERLLKELKQKDDGSGEDYLKCKLFKNFLLLATKDKPNIEQALDDFVSLASQDLYKEQIGPILGVATSYTMLKQGQRAKNQLKRVVKTVWSFEDADYLERCWLLLADYYVQSTKFDMAVELLKRILQHNKACSKAHEYSGYISEKEQRYKDATVYYENAWKFGGRNNSVIGYKLAYNYMKCKKYADAIDVCHQVLKQNPEYPKIKKDILDKCMNNLRT